MESNKGRYSLSKGQLMKTQVFGFHSLVAREPFLGVPLKYAVPLPGGYRPKDLSCLAVATIDSSRRSRRSSLVLRNALKVGLPGDWRVSDIVSTNFCHRFESSDTRTRSACQFLRKFGGSPSPTTTGMSFLFFVKSDASSSTANHSRSCIVERVGFDSMSTRKASDRETC